ncbi:MAG: UvrD/REP helicase [Verrucomicrobiales bacterium]|nr:UvrD/REP helicase [Verrucomicrobiales bacterium]
MLPHTLITASAGSGKTWRLTVRYLRLVMMGAAPESIVALTFSRKAAGEFFNAILHRLAEAAAHTTKAEALARDIEMPEMGTSDFCEALLRLTSRLPFLMLGTLDSFFIRLARSFPFELGLSGEFTMLDEHQLSVEKLRVYERVFAPDDSASEARAEFRRAFTEATFGKDEIRVRALLDDFVGSWHYQYLATPDPARWGNPRRIWPVNPPVPGPELDRKEVIARIRTGLARLGLTEKHAERWNGFLEAAAGHLPGAPVAEPMKYLWTRLLPLVRALENGEAELKMDRATHSLTGPLAEALAILLKHLIAGELAAVLRQTRGIFEVVKRYDDAYHTLVRRQGRLTFHDVQLILSGGLNPESAGHAAQAAHAPTHAENRQLMDYRLDARYAHWLLDEFQDTSRIQWRVLANLMDEAIQDSEGRKSFFAVGDQKQSIYEWRGGTPALFEELQAQYNLTDLPPEDHPLKVEPLSLSQRSGPAVIGMVNELLGDPEALREVLPDAAVDKWRWQHHESKNQHYRGAALVIETPPEPGADQDPDFAGVDPAWKRAAELLKELKPLKRGLTCAVICHRNDRALALTNFLRASTGMPAVCESDLSIAQDNPVTSALLALLQAAAHPGDVFAWQHLLMTPLAEIIESLSGPGSASGPAGAKSRQLPLVRKVLEQIAEVGFHDTLRWWAEELGTRMHRHHGDLDAFSRGRVDELCGCARQFDITGSRDIDEFLAYARSWTERGASHDGAIQVMTVHRSKGLTFDMVIIPDLGYPYTFINKFTVGRETDDQGEVQWLTRLPNKDISESDPVLSRALERAQGDTWCERLAGLYVMVTRAKFANYLFLPPPPKTDSGSTSLTGIVRQMLGQEDAGHFSIAGVDYPLIAAFGDADWIQDHPIRKAAQPVARPVLPGRAAAPLPATVQPDLFAPPVESKPAVPARAIPLRAKRPSEPEDPDGDDGTLFQTTRQAARAAGTAVHAAFARVRWLEEAEAALSGSGLLPEAVREVRQCLGDPALRAWFAKPDGPAEVWRERAFDLILDGAYQSGTFDRVVIHRDAEGRPLRADLIDFKTGSPTLSAAETAARHGRQLGIYRASLSPLLGLPAEKIRTAVLFTVSREAVEL